MYQLVVFLNYIVNFYELLIVVWCLLTWVPIRQGAHLPQLSSTVKSRKKRAISTMQLASSMTIIVEPYLSLFRRLIPPLGGMDFSPAIAMLALEFVWRAIVGILL